MNKGLNMLCAAAMGLMLGVASLVGTATASDYNYRILTPPTLTRTANAVSASSSKTLDLKLSVPQTFNITRPTKQINTTYEKYFITGTSDPSKPVYFDGKEIERIGTMGTFGVLADLVLGTNTFTFKQGDRQQSVTIVRKAPAGIVTISDITQGSMFPSEQGGGKVGENLPVSCVAPSGASVSATFGGKTVQLSQVATAQPGIPATFKGQLPVEGNYDPDTIIKAGAVTYTMTYNGATKAYKSSGSVYVAGKNTYIAARVTAYLGFVYPNASDLSVFKEYIRTGGADFVKLSSQTNGYFELYSGGWIPVSQVQIIEGTLKVVNTLSGASLKTGQKSETITFSGSNKPFFDAVVGENTFTFKLYNSAGTPSVSVAGSSLFSAVSVKNENKCTTYTFTFNDRARYWGYSVSYDDNGNTMLELNYKPKLGSASKPFEGITILVDPGHGGSDSGALGLPGTTGPMENTINLAHAYLLRDKLMALGATVYLTRDQDIYSSLDQRLMAIEEVRADLYLSVHHNSVAENADANTINGVEVYYHNATSKKLSDSILQSMSATGRKLRHSRQSYYRVTLLPQSPAVLMELGFLSNPAEYEKLTVRSQIELVTDSIVNGVREALK